MLAHTMNGAGAPVALQAGLIDEHLRGRNALACRWMEA